MTTQELVLVLASALLHAVWSVSIKGSRDPLAFNVAQLLPQIALAGVLLFWVDLSAIPPALWPLLAATGVAHGLYLYWMCRAYEQGDLTLVYPIVRSTPAFLPLLAVPLLGETIRPWGAAGIATVVLGLWLVQAGGPGGLRWQTFLAPGAGYAYLTLAATVAYGLLDKSAMSVLQADPWQAAFPRSVFYYFAIAPACGVLFLPLALRRTGWQGLREVVRAETGRTAFAIAATLASYTLILEAMRSAPASYVVAVRQSSVLFALLLSVLWLGESPTRGRVLGAALTVAGVAAIGWAG